MSDASAPALARVVARVAAHQPRLLATPHDPCAATALVLDADPHAGPRVLFVERAVREGDRWSGHMALPGGRCDREDRDLLATATREAREEVGLELPSPVGRLDDVRDRFGRVVVATFVFAVDHAPELRPEPAEVQTTVWIPLVHLADPTSAGEHWERGIGPFPAIRYRGFTVWGLTHRIIGNLLDLDVLG